MKAAILLLPLLLSAAPLAEAGLGKVRRLIENKETAKAVELLDELLAKEPKDPWLLYNRAVAAYAQKDFPKADAMWQDLAGWNLPDPLREQVWTQIGNVSYRLAEPALEQQPDTAIARLEQSREAYRVAISQNKRNEMAGKNLVFVEKQLELLYARLAQRLVDEAKKESVHERAVDKLTAALDHQQNATALNPNEPAHPKAEQEIREMIAQRLNQKGGEAEKRADQIAAQKSLDQWKRDSAKENFQAALADFREAQSFDEGNQESKAGEQRVQDKLSDMLAQAGREAQKQGDKLSKNSPDQAFEKYEKALENYNEALAAKAEHQDAQAGRKETLDAMEQLHLREGDKMAKSGEAQAKNSPSDAARNLLGALDHFEQARDLNPENPEIPPRIEQVQKLLPDVLAAMGQREQQRAEKAEPNSVKQAVAHLEQAEASFDKAQQLQPSHQPSKEGLEEVQEDLSRLRKDLAQQQSEQEQKQGKPEKQGDQPSYAAMLAQVRAQQQEREANAKYQRGVKYQDQGNRGRNW